MEIRSVQWAHPDAVALREAMSEEMNAVYADRLFPQSAFHVADADVLWTGLAAIDNEIIGHVALRTLAGGVESGVEVKRMTVAPAHRGRGVAWALLRAAHEQAYARGYRRALLQTGDRQPAAVALYERAGYTRVPLFPPYEEITFSICMAKALDGRYARVDRPPVAPA